MDPVIGTSELNLQPQLKRVVLVAVWFQVGLWFMLGGCLLYSMFFSTMDPKVQTFQVVFMGIPTLSTLLFGLSFLDFAVCKSHWWRASAAGIDVYGGQTLRKQIPWNHVTAITVHPFCIICRYRSDNRPNAIRMYWTSPDDGNKLKEMWRRKTG